jgi:YfiH family protein
MYLCRRGDLEWLEFDLLRGLPGIRHAFLLRQGGRSSSPYDSLNCGLGIGDDHKSVLHNRMCAQMLLGAKKLVSCRQVHGVTIRNIGKHSKHIARGDGMMTGHSGMALLTLCADCQCALFVDPKKRVIANVHAGWRGCVAEIYRKTVELLRRNYGCRPRDLLVGIGPSLGPKHAEFVNYSNELPSYFWHYQTLPTYFDFWAISRAQLEECGILSHHIEVAEMCTYEQSEKCFSYRREHTTGRHGMLIAL